MKSKTRLISYLFRFMLNFEINRFWILTVSEESIKARVGWANDGPSNYDENEEIQDIEWAIQDFDNLEDALEISEFLIDNKLISNDKIIISKEDLLHKIEWESSRYFNAINTLLEIRVYMIDDTKKTDYFFIHF